MIKMGKDYTCNKCGYQWTSRKGQDAPAYCPRCASKKIEIEQENIEESPDKSGEITLTKCDYCGRSIKISEVKGECQGITKVRLFKVRCPVPHGAVYDSTTKRYREIKQLCSKCINDCKSCHKVFCPEHLNNHKC